MTSLDLSDDTRDRRRGWRKGVAFVAFLLVILLAVTLIYILLLVGGIFAFRWLWKSWREWQNSVYKLEREFAVRRLSQAAATARPGATPNTKICKPKLKAKKLEAV